MLRRRRDDALRCAALLLGDHLRIALWIGLARRVRLAGAARIDAMRREKMSPHDAIYKACLLRFRPIMMTTTGAILGALPLAIGLGEGSELRQPLGIGIVGGLRWKSLRASLGRVIGSDRVRFAEPPDLDKVRMHAVCDQEVGHGLRALH